MDGEGLIPTPDGIPTLWSARFGQTYGSRHGALAEALHVFLEQSGAGERLRAGWVTRVLEIGFGTGLNFWATAREALKCGTELHYTALEFAPLPRATLEALAIPQHLGLPTAFTTAFLDAYVHLPDKEFMFARDGIRCEIVVQDAATFVFPQRAFDVVYLDAFSPDANPELWTVGFLSRLKHALVPGGRLTTYSAKGSVRRAMQEAGFRVEKVPGPPRKREMLRGTAPGGDLSVS